MHDAYWEAIRIERMLNRSHMEITKPLAGNFQRSTKAHIVETMANEIKTGVEKPIQDSSRFNATLEQFSKEMQDMMAQMIALQQEEQDEEISARIERIERSGHDE